MPISHKMFFTKPPQKFDQMTSIILTIIRHRTLKQWRFAALWKISSIELDFVGLIITYSVVIVGGIQLGRGGCSWSRPRSPTWFMRPPIHTNGPDCPLDIVELVVVICVTAHKNIGKKYGILTCTLIILPHIQRCHCVYDVWEHSIMRP